MRQKFIDLLLLKGFKQVVKKANYIVFKSDKISIMYIRVYKEKYTVAMYADTEEFQYKRELYSNFNYDTKNLLFDLIKDNNEIKERILEETNRIKEENKNKKVIKFEK